MTSIDEIVRELEDLLKQATTERSHYYVAKCCRNAISALARSRRMEEALRHAAQTMQGLCVSLDLGCMYPGDKARQDDQVASAIKEIKSIREALREDT